ncbi:MAG TPA: tannase/feruloyl esterase family alpha/beta hydrolase, partial [Armatimonadota bacterium]|nr:tannase/feruloyl esterase family alpha/beta hydrolase [Armatimonadota bacterium]
AITGERIFNGIPIGSEFSPATGNLYLFNWVFGPHKNLSEIDFGKDFDAYTAALAPYLNAENPNLSPFFNHGGKLIMVSGSADSVVPYHATLDYYEQVIENFGSLDTVKLFYRYFIVPGGNHSLVSPAICEIPNLLNVVIRWREENTAPDILWCRQLVDGHPGATFPLYPYPSKTAWDDQNKCYEPVDGPRGGVDRVAEQFRPPATE